jgi:hypothetical protein
MVASEMAPWAKTGGLADVLAALPEALDNCGHRVTVVLPRYHNLTVPTGRSWSHRVRLGPLSHDVHFHVAQMSERLRAVFVDCPKYFDRPGYYGETGRDYPDNAERFGLLAVAALERLRMEPCGWSPRRSLLNILSSVPCAKHSTVIRGRPAATRRRLTSRSTTVFMNAWWAIARLNRSPVRDSISSIQSATASVSRSR